MLIRYIKIKIKVNVEPGKILLLTSEYNIYLKIIMFAFKVIVK